MRVDWNAPGPEQANMFVAYGASPTTLTSQAQARSYTYTIDDVCGPPANNTATWVDPGFMYTAVMANLTLGQDIFYAYGNGTTTSSVAQFHVGPKSATQTAFLAYGDMPAGTAIDENSTSLVQQHLGDADFVLHVGDISYAVGNGAIWDQWFEEVEPIARAVPYHVCPGNHEFDWPGQSFNDSLFSYGRDSGGECGVPYVIVGGGS
jgi:hypothetical protein